MAHCHIPPHRCRSLPNPAHERHALSGAEPSDCLARDPSTSTRPSTPTRRVSSGFMEEIPATARHWAAETHQGLKLDGVFSPLTFQSLKTLSRYFCTPDTRDGSGACRMWRGSRVRTRESHGQSGPGTHRLHVHGLAVLVSNSEAFDESAIVRAEHDLGVRRHRWPRGLESGINGWGWRRLRGEMHAVELPR